MTADPKPGPEEQDDDGDAWIRLPGGEAAIRIRSLDRYLAKGGQLTAARLVEDVEGLHTVWVRLADRPGEYRINQYHADVAKVFKDPSFAIAALRNDFHYYGDIILATDRRPG